MFGKDTFRDLLKCATLQEGNSQHIVVVKFRIERLLLRLNGANESTALVTCLDTKTCQAGAELFQQMLGKSGKSGLIALPHTDHDLADLELGHVPLLVFTLKRPVAGFSPRNNTIYILNCWRI